VAACRLRPERLEVIAYDLIEHARRRGLRHVRGGGSATHAVAIANGGPPGTDRNSHGNSADLIPTPRALGGSWVRQAWRSSQILRPASRPGRPRRGGLPFPTLRQHRQARVRACQGRGSNARFREGPDAAPSRTGCVAIIPILTSTDARHLARPPAPMAHSIFMGTEAAARGHRHHRLVPVESDGTTGMPPPVRWPWGEARFLAAAGSARGGGRADPVRRQAVRVRAWPSRKRSICWSRHAPPRARHLHARQL
jgi:hypothetical protein